MERHKIVTSMKRHAENTQETSPTQIQTQMVHSANVAILGQMPSKYATHKLIQQKRCQLQATLPTPQNFEELIIPQAYQL